jgi:hypothetical protein
VKTKVIFLLLGIAEFIFALLLTFSYETRSDLILIIAAYTLGVIFSGIAFYLLIYGSLINKMSRWMSDLF